MKDFYIKNIDRDTLGNNNFRNVIFTGEHLQLVLMNLKPGEDIGGEVHSDLDQFFRIESGSGKAVIEGVDYEFGKDFGIVIPAGVEHNIINTGDKPLKLYSIYAPPHHKEDKIEPVKTFEELNRIPTFNSFNELNESKKPKSAPDWHDSDAPDAEGRFRDLSPKDLAKWLIKTRKKDLRKITGSLNQQIVFNRNNDPEYAKKMEKTREEVYKQLGREDLLESIEIEYKGKQYWVNSSDLNDHKNTKIFAFTDSNLSNVAKVNGKTLMFTINDIQDFIKEAVSYSDSIFNGKRYVSNWAGSTNKESEFIKLIKELPETLKSIKVPVSTSSFNPETRIFKGPITNSVKNRIIKIVKDMSKKFNEIGDPIQEYYIKSYGGIYNFEKHQKDDAYIHFSTQRSSNLAKGLGSGKFGKLD